MAGMQIIIRYDELHLKSEPVKREMLRQLKKNTRKATGRNVHIDNGRLVVDGYDKKIVNALQHTFGVASLSPVLVAEKNMDAITKAAKTLMCRFSKKKTFKVEAVRSDKSFPLNSQQIKERIGEIFFNKGYGVRMKSPDKTITIEIRNKAYVYDTSCKGPGGMPLGTAGYFTARLRNEKDMLAAWLMMKRGAFPVIVSKTNKKLLAKLEKWSSGRKIKTVKTATAVASVTGETNIQQLSSMPKTTFAPLVGFSRTEIRKLAAKI